MVKAEDAPTPMGARVARWLVWGVMLAALALGGCVPRAGAPTPTVIASPAPSLTPIPLTATPTPLPPTATPDPAVPFAAPPLEPRGHASVMIPSAIPYLDGLGDAPRYQIAASFDPATMTLRGRERVRVVNRAGVALDELYFRLYPNTGRLYGPARLELTQVADDAGHALSWSAGADASVVRVALPVRWEAGDAQVLTLEWQATIPVEGDRLWTREQGYGIFRQAEGLIVLAEWFPMLAVYEDGGWRLDAVPEWGDPVYSEIAFYEVWFTAPEAYTIVATGGEVASAHVGGSVTHAFRSGPARDFFVALGTSLGTATAHIGDVTVRSYAHPGHGASGAEALAAGRDAVTVYGNRFGPYPYRELDIVEAPLIGLLGMEYPGVVLVSDALYTPAEKWRLDITTAHEVAHQWWYGVVGNDILREPWLDEALATFSSGVYVQDIMGSEAFRTQYDQWVARYETGQRNGTVGAVTWPVGRFRTSWDYVTTVYYKGAIALQTLRTDIGDAAFFRALRRHYEQSRFKMAQGQDLLALLEQEAGRDLDDFYRRWFFSE
ncbi:MAG: M1 family metallopeptidase [Anaerolineales bacterium]